MRSGPRRRRWVAVAVLAAAGLTVGAAVLGSGWHEAPTAASSPCANAGAPVRLAGIWDADVAARIGAAFGRTGHPDARTSALALAAVLDRHTATWRTMRVDACEATHVRHEQSPALLDLRVACLDARLEQLAALTSVLAAAPDRAVVDHAVQAAYDLAPLAACEDTKALTAAVPLPDDPTTREEIATARHELGRAKALRDAGRPRDALPVAEATVSGAQRIGWRPLEAETLYQAGELYQDVGRDADAAAAYERAVLAAEAGRHDELGARAAIALVDVCAAGLAQFDRGKQWGERAGALLERLGDSPELSAARENELGTLAWMQGEFPVARTHYLRALELQRGRLAADDPHLATTYVNLGNVTDDLGDHEGALGYYAKALALREQLFGKEHPAVSDVLNNVGIVLGVLGRYDEARATLERCLAIRRRAFGDVNAQVGQTLNNLGDLLGQQGKAAEALDYFERGLALRSRLLPSDHPHMGTSYYNVASALVMLGRHVEAIEPFQKALAISSTAYGKDSADYADNLYQLGLCYRAAGRKRDARAAFTTVLASWTREPPGDAKLVAEVRGYLGTR